MTFRAIALVLAVAGTPACEEPEASPVMEGLPADRADPVSRPRREDVADSLPVRTRVIPSESRLAGGGGGGGGGGGAAQKQPRWVPRGRVMTADEAQAAARAMMQQQSSSDDALCQQVYEAAVFFSRAYHDKTPNAHGRGIDREAFMTGCRSRPRDEQQCLVPRYYGAHMDECRRVLGGRDLTREGDEIVSAEITEAEPAAPEEPTPPAIGPTRLGGIAPTTEEP